MKLNEMNILITGANGFLASNLIKYFSNTNSEISFSLLESLN